MGPGESLATPPDPLVRVTEVPLRCHVSKGTLERLEPDDAKVSRPVLRGEGGGNIALLPGAPSMGVG